MTTHESCLRVLKMLACFVSWLALVLELGLHFAVKICGESQTKKSEH